MPTHTLCLPLPSLPTHRYFQDKDWTLKKMEVLVDVPDVIDLEPLRAPAGPAPGEVLQPEQQPEQQQQQQQQPAAAAQPAQVSCCIVCRRLH